MNVYKIPEALYDKYHGAGYAVCAILNGAVADIVYLRDTFEEFDDEAPNEDINYLKSYIANEKLAPTIRYLQSLGEVSFGMCSCYEFVEL